MSLKLRIWTGRETLASLHGKRLPNAFAFDAWLSLQPSGVLEVWAGRWWQVSLEARPFEWDGHRLSCRHPTFVPSEPIEPKTMDGLMRFEAWKKAEQIAAMWGVLGRITEAVTEISKESQGDHE